MYKKRVFSKSRSFDEFVIGADIGGTNTNIGIAGVKKGKTKLLFSFHYLTKDLNDIITPLNEVLKLCAAEKIKPKKACLAVAGPIEKQKAKGTNFSWSIDANMVVKKTTLSKCILINDFEAVGYSLNVLEKTDHVTLQKGREDLSRAKLVLGAGTGLGKAIVPFDTGLNAFIPLPSEGGHGDISFYREENALESFFSREGPVSQEAVLSGKGIEMIYAYFRMSAKQNRILYEIDSSRNKPKTISKYYKKDKVCRQTLDTFAKFYIRVLKNFCLDVLPMGGAYIAGGIAAKNRILFTPKLFKEEFFRCDQKFHKLLKRIPISLITNYDVSMRGAAFAASKNGN